MRLFPNLTAITHTKVCLHFTDLNKFLCITPLFMQKMYRKGVVMSENTNENSVFVVKKLTKRALYQLKAKKVQYTVLR